MGNEVSQLTTCINSGSVNELAARSGSKQLEHQLRTGNVDENDIIHDTPEDNLNRWKSKKKIKTDSTLKPKNIYNVSNALSSISLHLLEMIF